MPLQKRRIPWRIWNSPFLKQLQLLPWSIWELRLVAIEKLYVAELFVGDAHDADLAELWQHGFDPLAVNLCILHAGTVAHIDGELKHGEPILDEAFAEPGVFLDVLLRLSWQVEQY